MLDRTTLAIVLFFTTFWINVDNADAFHPSEMLRAVNMTDTNFGKFVAEQGGGGGRDGEGWVLLFYMPWCGYCKDVLPVWDRLADELKGEVSVGKVNLLAEEAVAHRFRHNVKGYPTMVFVDGDQMTTYSGNRDINNLKTFARGGWKGEAAQAISPIPPDPAQFSLPQKIHAYVEDFVLDVSQGYRGIWQNYQNEFLSAISTSFSLGGIFGFGIKILIDTVFIPPLPPRAPRPKAKAL